MHAATDCESSSNPRLSNSSIEGMMRDGEEFLDDESTPSDESKRSAKKAQAQALSLDNDESANDDDDVEGNNKKSIRKKEVNPLFKDVEQTGAWGRLERKELLIAATFIVVTVVAVVVTVVVLLTGKKDNSSSTMSLAKPTPPTPAPTNKIPTTPEEQLLAIRNATEVHQTLLPNSLALLPADSFFYVDKWSDTAQPAQVRAASWVMYEDGQNEPPSSPWLLTRYALAVFYYSTNGTDWTNHTNWLSATPACSWNGIICDRFGNVVKELDLHNENLVGPLPHELVFFQDLTALTLYDNTITGTVPSKQLGNMQQLVLLSLQTNQMTGTLSTDLIENNALISLFIQENSITGAYPFEFCPPKSAPPVFEEFGLDCKEFTRCICCAAVDGIDPCYD